MKYSQEVGSGHFAASTRSAPPGTEIGSPGGLGKGLKEPVPALRFTLQPLGKPKLSGSLVALDGVKSCRSEHCFSVLGAQAGGSGVWLLGNGPPSKEQVVGSSPSTYCAYCGLHAASP